MGLNDTIDKRIHINVEGEVKKAFAEELRKIQNLDGKNVNVKVDADTSSAETKIRQIVANPAKVKITADTRQFVSDVEAARKQAEKDRQTVGFWERKAFEIERRMDKLFNGGGNVSRKAVRQLEGEIYDLNCETLELFDSISKDSSSFASLKFLSERVDRISEYFDELKYNWQQTVQAISAPVQPVAIQQIAETANSAATAVQSLTDRCEQLLSVLKSVSSGGGAASIIQGNVPYITAQIGSGFSDAYNLATNLSFARNAYNLLNAPQTNGLYNAQLAYSNARLMLPSGERFVNNPSYSYANQFGNASRQANFGNWRVSNASPSDYYDQFSYGYGRDYFANTGRPRADIYVDQNGNASFSPYGVTLALPEGFQEQARRNAPRQVRAHRVQGKGIVDHSDEMFDFLEGGGSGSSGGSGGISDIPIPKEKSKGLFEGVLGTSLGKYITRLATYQIVSGAIYNTVNSFKEALSTMKEVDSELASIQKVTDFTADQMAEIEESSYSVASTYGVSAQEYLESVSAFAKAGYKDLADDLGELAIKTQLVGDVTASTANKFLLSVDAAWQMNGSVEDLSRVLDEANVVENNYATSIDKLAQGMPNVASVASMAGMTAEETIAALGTITAVTQQSGTKAATALRALILNIMKDTTTEVEEGVTVTKEQVETLDEVIQKYAGDAIGAAQATGEIVNPMTVVAALAKAYQENAITDRDLAKIEMALGGKLRTNQLDALLKNFYGADGEEGMYEGMLNKIAEAAGSADKEVGIMLDTWKAKADILKNTWTEFVSKTVSTDIFKGILDGATKALKVVGDLGTALTGLGGILAGKFFINLPNTIKSISKSIADMGGLAGLGKNALIMGVTSAISAAIIIYQKYRKSIIDAMNASLEEAKKTSESSEKLFDLVNAYERAEEGSQAMKTASEQLASALGLEGDAVDSLKEKYQELTEAKLREATGNAAEAMANASKAIETEFQFNSDTLTVSRGGGNIADIIQRNLKDFYDEYSGYYHAGQTFESKMAFARASQEALAEVKTFAGGLKDEVERNKIFDSTQYHDLVNINNALSEYIANYDAAGKLLERSRINEDIFEAKDNGHIETQEDYERYRDSLKATIEDTETLNAVLGTLEKTFPQFSGYVAEGTDALAEEEKQLDATTNAIERYKNAKATDKDGNKKKSEKDDNFKTVAGAFGTMRDEAKKGRYQSNEFQDAAALVLGQNYMSTHTTKEAKKHIDELQKMGVFNPDSAGTGLYNLIKNNKDVEKTADGYYAVADGLAAVKKNADGTFDFKITDNPEELEQVANALEVSATSLVAMQQAMGVFDGSIDVSALDDLLNKVDTLKQKSEEETTVNYTTNAGEVTTAVQTLATEAPKAAGEWDLTYNIKVNGTIPKGAGGGGSSGGGGGLRGGGGMTYEKQATGTSNFKGGLTWVNDEQGGFNPELIETGGKSFFVNGGKPALVSLPRGTIIHNATDTRKLFAQDFTEVPHFGTGTAPLPSGIADRSGRVAGIGSGKGSANSKDWWEKLQQYMEDLLEKAGDALDKQLEAIDAELFYLQYGKEVSEKATKLEEARMDLLEAEQELINAQTERTVRYFNAETGQWEWMADQRDIIQAQEDLADKQKAYLQAQYDYLEDVWSELKDDIQKAIDGKKDVNIEKVLKQMLKSKAGGLAGNVEGLIGDLLNLITAFSNGTALDSYDSGGIANGLGYMYKATKADEVVLNGKLSNAILSPKRSQQFADFTSSLERMFGMASMMERPRSIAGFSTTDSHNNIVYMNGIKIGSDMLNKPLSEVLSVLPIYCN